MSVTTKNILITGVRGFIGSALSGYLANKGHRVTGLDITAGEGTLACDVTNGEALSALLDRLHPEVIVHCAALKNLPACEEDKAGAFAANSLSTEIIADFAARAGAKVVYPSSDVVFDGKRGNYEPADQVRPVNWYGKTKCFSEVILSTVPRATICRTALIIGKLTPHYEDLLSAKIAHDVIVNQTLLPQYIYKRLQAGQPVRLPRTIISNPTPIELLCEIISRIIDQDATGILHTAGPDALSRYETGLLIADAFGFDRALIIADDTKISPLRPRNISLDSNHTYRQLGLNIDQDQTQWQLKHYLADEALYA